VTYASDSAANTSGTGESPGEYTSPAQSKQSRSGRRARRDRDQGQLVSFDDATNASWPSRNYLHPFPPSWNGKLRFSVQGSLSSTTSGACGTEWVFRLNSLYDPDFTYTGHQPYGYDQLSAIYGQYVVNAVDVEILATDPTADGAALCAVVQPSQASTTVSGKLPDQISEQEFGAVGFINNTGGQKIAMRRTFQLHQVEGISRAQYDTQLSVYGAAVSANPSLSPWLRVALADMNGASGTVVRIMFNLVYHAKFYRRNVLAQS